MGVASGCGEQEVGVASGCGCKEVYRFSHTTYSVSALFCSSIPIFVHIIIYIFLNEQKVGMQLQKRTNTRHNYIYNSLQPHPYIPPTPTS